MAWTVEFHPEVADDLDDLGDSAASKILKAIKDKIENWGFHAHLDTQSTLTWTLIPRPLGH